MAKKNTYNTFDTDPALEKNGTWVNLGGIGKFLLAYTGGANDKFEKMLEEHTRPYKRILQLGAMDEDTAKEVMVKVFIDAVLLNWENVTDRNGQSFPYSKENALKLLTDLPHLLKTLQEEAGSFANYRKEQLDDEAKN